MKTAGEYRVRAGMGGNVHVRNYYTSLYMPKALNAERQAAQTLYDTVDFANDVSKSFSKSYKYLRSIK